MTTAITTLQQVDELAQFQHGDYSCPSCGREYNRHDDIENGFAHPVNCICQNEEVER